VQIEILASANPTFWGQFSVQTGVWYSGWYSDCGVHRFLHEPLAAVSDCFSLSARITDISDGSFWDITGVYEPQDDSDKIAFLQELRDLRPLMLRDGSSLEISTSLVKLVTRVILTST
jgi:hypothetical protein